MHWAAGDGNMAVVQHFLENGYSVNEPDAEARSYYTPLMWAACRGHEDMLELLLRSGADITQKDKHQNTARMIAEQKRQAPCVARLREVERERSTEAAMEGSEVANSSPQNEQLDEGPPRVAAGPRARRSSLPGTAKDLAAAAVALKTGSMPTGTAGAKPR